MHKPPSPHHRKLRPPHPLALWKSPPPKGPTPPEPYRCALPTTVGAADNSPGSPTSSSDSQYSAPPRSRDVRFPPPPAARSAGDRQTPRPPTGSGPPEYPPHEISEAN